MRKVFLAAVAACCTSFLPGLASNATAAPVAGSRSAAAFGAAAAQSGALSPSYTLVQRRARAAGVRGGRAGAGFRGGRVARFRGTRFAGTGRGWRRAGYRRGWRGPGAGGAFALGLTGGLVGAGLGYGYGYDAGLGLGLPLLGLGLGLGWGGWDGGWGWGGGAGAALGFGAGALLGASIAGAAAGGGSSGLVGFVGRRPVIVRGSPAARLMCARNFQGWTPAAGTVLIGGEATRCPYL